MAGNSWRIWLVSALPAFAFTVGYLANGELSGVLAIWSIGLTLFLPWPLYAFALCLATVTVLHSLRQNRPIAWAMVLLAAGGYAPQLTYQAFIGLIALWLLLSSAAQDALVAEAMTHLPKVPAFG